MADGLKDRNLQDYYESMQKMFDTPGWKYLMEDLTKVHDTANTLSGITSLTDLDFRRGQIDILQLIISQPVVIAGAFQLLLDNEDEK